MHGHRFSLVRCASRPHSLTKPKRGDAFHCAAPNQRHNLTAPASVCQGYDGRQVPAKILRAGCMSQVSVSAAELLLRRSSALPLSRPSSEAAFVPDSSVVADVIPSGNYGERRNGREPDMIVLHYTGMADGRMAVQRLTTVGTEVSAHYI